ncbi:hypothetical protein WDA79_17325 [Streptomyces sp. A475]|uniref:hypothetical protein n=1 Tax=Streptomyces sp. A475 TaxID=3131976 RepID=UPI0030C9111B
MNDAVAAIWWTITSGLAPAKMIPAEAVVVPAGGGPCAAGGREPPSGPPLVVVPWTIRACSTSSAPDTAAVERFRRSGGGPEPVAAGLKVCWGTNPDQTIRIAHLLWADA